MTPAIACWLRGSVRRVAWIHPDQAKARKTIPVPLGAEDPAWSALGRATDTVGMLAHDLDHETNRHPNGLGEPRLASIHQRDWMRCQHIGRQAFQCRLGLGEEARENREPGPGDGCGNQR